MQLALLGCLIDIGKRSLRQIVQIEGQLLFELCGVMFDRHKRIVGFCSERI